MKAIITIIFLTVTTLGFSQTTLVPDSVLSELRELRERQDNLSNVVSYSGHNIKTGIVFIGIGMASGIVGGALVAIPTNRDERAGKVSVQQAIGMGFLSLGCVLNLGGIVSIGIGGGRMDRLKVN